MSEDFIRGLREGVKFTCKHFLKNVNFINEFQRTIQDSTDFLVQEYLNEKKCDYPGE